MTGGGDFENAPDPAMSTDLIRYDLQVQDALRGVVRKVLADAARDGLPGEHHFYITFRTQSPGVQLSPRLREQYPDEMTIILQYQFWDLKVDDEGFEVGLHFKNIPEKLHIPFEAISGFYDPSVQFGLKFEALGDLGPEEDEDDEEIELPPPPRIGAASPEKPTLDKTAAPAPLADAESGAKSEPAADEGGAKVVSIDAFRKKT